jgi:DNA-binding HxlR family transcriptional regulator
MTPRKAPAAPEETAVAPRTCDASLSRAFEFLGKRWNGVLLGSLGQGPSTFSELKRILGVGDSTLSDRLAELTHAGLVKRTVDEGPPIAVSYELTDAGMAVMPAMHLLADWAGANLTEERCRTAPR